MTRKVVFRYSEIKDEVTYYENLLKFYKNLINFKIDENARKDILRQTKNIIQKTNRNISDNFDKKSVEERQMFYLNYYELSSQINLIVIRLNLKVHRFNAKKLEMMIKELGVMLDAQDPEHSVKHLDSGKKANVIIGLVSITFKKILLTFGAGVVLNLILRATGVYSSLGNVLENLLALEVGVGALIVFITSFNLSYTNTKRGDTHVSLIRFCNTLNIYSRAIKNAIVLKERNLKKRLKLYEDIDYYMDCIGFNLIEGVQSGYKYQLKFDIVVLQCFDRIKKIIDPYFEKLDPEAKNRAKTIQDELIDKLNTFQIIATTRVPVIFDQMNGWLIRITYFILASIAPYSTLPRLFITNFLQRIFYTTANQTDNAILSGSLAKIPVDERVVRRMSRISKVLSE